MRDCATAVSILCFLTGTAGAQSFSAAEVTVRAFGDVNLGRIVGQKIFGGDTLFPFRSMLESLSLPDLVLVNLESPLTDQGGETQHPADNYRFCGPLSGGATLRLAGIDMVTTANNHAYDYGKRGLNETIAVLESSGVAQAGLSVGKRGTFPPVILERGGVRVGVVAYAEFVNRTGNWGGTLSVYERGRARREIASLRKKVDLVVAAYHGGSEYTPVPPGGTLRNLRALAQDGADIVVGHHPHVPQGVEMLGSSAILYSLGNFVFYQPQRYWTQVGLSACVHIVHDDKRSRAELIHLIPFRAGLQPSFGLPDATVDSLRQRFEQFSPSPLRREGSSFIPWAYEHTRF